MWACGTAGSALASGAGLSHLHLPPATICAPGSVAGFAGNGFATVGAGGIAPQQPFAFFGASAASQQLVLVGLGGSGCGAGAGGFGSEQQHAAAACWVAEHAHDAEPVAAHAPGRAGNSLADAATGSATAGVNWPTSARTARAVRR